MQSLSSLFLTISDERWLLLQNVMEVFVLLNIQLPNVSPKFKEKRNKKILMHSYKSANPRKWVSLCRKFEVSFDQTAVLPEVLKLRSA